MKADDFYHNPNHSHFSNATGSHTTPCSVVLSLPYQDRCNFILKTSECRASVHYFDYLNFIFCNIGANGESVYIGGVVLMLILCLYLFTVLATTADKFFCPALAVISKMLKMSENLAGVTLLAFGNGSPDIFASLSNSSGDTELVYSELIGAAVFVTGFIAGIIIFIQPFKLVARTYVRDVMFFLFAIVLISNCIHDGGYSLMEGVGTVMIYVAYLAVVIFEHLRMKREARNIRKLSLVMEDEDSAAEIVKKAEDLEDITEIKIHSRRDSSIILDEDILKILNKMYPGNGNENLFKTFLKSINPIDQQDWAAAGLPMRIVMTLKAPVVFVLLLVIPIVDYGEERHGWSKLLNMLNIMTLPQLLLFITGSIKMIFFNYIPLSVIVLLISLGLALAVHCTSRNDCPPKYHVTFAAGSFIGSVCVIYTVAKEVVCVMKAIGTISRMTDSFVGLSLLAIGNSVGDLFSNISLAKQGYHQMAFAACFGGPLFNSLLGVGLTFIVKALNSTDHWASTREGALGPNCIIFLFLILFMPLLAHLFTNFKSRKSIGIYMILIYGHFIFYSLLGEVNVMHTYGTDHERT